MRYVYLLTCATMMLCGTAQAADLSGLPGTAGVTGGVVVVVGDIDAETLGSLRTGPITPQAGRR